MVRLVAIGVETFNFTWSGAVKLARPLHVRGLFKSGNFFHKFASLPLAILFVEAVDVGGEAVPHGGHQTSLEQCSADPHFDSK